MGDHGSVFRSDRLRNILRWVGGWLVCASSAYATDYYVSPTGDDGNPGTEAAPFATIRRAFRWDAAVNPGDRVYLRGGTHYPSQGTWIGYSGSSSDPIILQPYPGEVAIIHGAMMPADTTFIGIGASHIVVRDLVLRQSTRTGITVWGETPGVSDIAIRNNTISQCQRGGIYVGHENADMTTVQNVVVEGNTVFQCCLMNQDHVLNEGWPAAISVSGTTAGSVLGNTVYENHGEGIGILLANQCTVSQNTVYDNFSVNIYLDNATNIEVERNLIASTGNPDYLRDFDTGPGEEIHRASGVQIANEWSYDFANPSAGNIIQNNLFVGNRNALHYGNYQNGGGLHDTQFMHNTVYGAEQVALDVDADTHSNSYFANNMIVQTFAAPLTSIDEPSAGLTFEYNLWFGGTPQPVAQHPSDVSADPRFLNPVGLASSGYALAPGSPAIGGGTVLLAVTEDLRGVSRQGPADLGALAYLQGDFDGDAYVDAGDRGALAACASGPAIPVAGACDGKDLDRDGDVDQSDFGLFQRCFAGDATFAGTSCDDQ